MPKNELLTIRIPTATLRDLLKDSPEAMIELEARAVEKVAEEIMRKGKNLTDVALGNRIEHAYHLKMRELTANSGFPKEALDRISRVTSDRIELYMTTEARTIVNKASETAERKVQGQVAEGVKLLQQAIDEKYAEATAALTDTIRKIAREEFFEVLREARGTQ